MGPSKVKVYNIFVWPQALFSDGFRKYRAWILEIRLTFCCFQFTRLKTNPNKSKSMGILKTRLGASNNSSNPNKIKKIVAYYNPTPCTDPDYLLKMMLIFSQQI